MFTGFCQHDLKRSRRETRLKSKRRNGAAFYVRLVWFFFLVFFSFVISRIFRCDVEGTTSLVRHCAMEVSPMTRERLYRWPQTALLALRLGQLKEQKENENDK